MNIWRCPHPSLFLREICETLDACQNHCIVSVPWPLVQSFQEELASYWRETREELPILTLDDETPIIDAMMPLFDFDCQNPALADFKEFPLMGSRTLAVFLPQKPLAHEEEFFAFLVDELASHAKNRRDSAQDLIWNMLVIAPADRNLPKPDIGLKCFYWWGRLHNSDLEYAMEHAFLDVHRAGARSGKLNYWWLYPICKGLGFADPSLVEDIFQSFPKDMESLASCLSRHPLNTVENGNLAREFLEDAQHPPLRNECPAGFAAKLWHNGLLEKDYAGQPAIHPAALVAADRLDELEGLVTHGQMLFFLPLVQDVHYRLSKLVENRLGGSIKDWLPTDGRLSAAQEEIGPFYAFLSYLHKERGKHFPNSIVETARKWRDLRNCLAHIKMLPYETVENALLLYERLCAMN